MCQSQHQAQPLEKREWCYAQKPEVYDVHCDQCGGDHTTWSECKGMIWCFDCEKDTPGTPGVFGGPVPLGACALMGIRFDRIRLSDNKLLKMTVEENGEITYSENEDENP